MFNVRLAGVHLYGKWLFAWVSLVMSLMVSYFMLSFFSRDLFILFILFVYTIFKEGAPLALMASLPCGPL